MQSYEELRYNEYSEEFKLFYERVLVHHINLISKYNTPEKYEEAKKNPLFFINIMKSHFLYMRERFEKFEKVCDLDWLLINHQE